MDKCGRKKGTPKTGGRKAGTLNKDKSTMLDTIQETGITPAEYFAQVLQDKEGKAGARAKAAETLMQYCYRKMPIAQEVLLEDKREPGDIIDDANERFRLSGVDSQ